MFLGVVVWVPAGVPTCGAPSDSSAGRLTALFEGLLAAAKNQWK